MRAIFIVLGITLIEKFHFIIYIFGAFLIITGIRMVLQKEKEIHPERNPVVILFRRFMLVLNYYEGGNFFKKVNGKRFATPLFLTLIIVETTDLLFAVDSIPAILAITTDTFIVYTSNVFAILGLRALYFALAGIMKLFHHLHYGLSAILVFVGLKMMLADFYKLPITLSLIIIAVILMISITTSILYPKKEK
jgi:tellurite resistance protein TerC